MTSEAGETAIVLPDLDAGDDEVRISCWLVDPGDAVECGDRLIEVLLKGITFDVPAPVAGTLTRIEKPLNALVTPGDVLGWIQPADDEEDEEETSPPDDSTSQPDAGI